MLRVNRGTVRRHEVIENAGKTWCGLRVDELPPAADADPRCDLCASFRTQTGERAELGWTPAQTAGPGRRGRGFEGPR